MEKKLSEEQREILYSCGTEVPGTSELLHEKREGVYVTADKELPVFKSEHKFESGTGWPSFYEANHENIILKEDRSHGMIRTEVISKDNALDAKITELDLNNRIVKLSVKAAQIDEEKSLIAKFGEGATKSGATLKGIFEKAIGKKNKKNK